MPGASSFPGLGFALKSGTGGASFPEAPFLSVASV